MEFLLISDFRISIVLTSAIIVGVRKPLTHFDLILTGQFNNYIFKIFFKWTLVTATRVSC